MELPKYGVPTLKTAQKYNLKGTTNILPNNNTTTTTTTTITNNNGTTTTTFKVHPSNDQWYYVDRFGTSKGPCTLDELALLYIRREVYDQTYVWNGTDTVEWTPLYQVTSIYAFIQGKIKNKEQVVAGGTGSDISLERPIRAQSMNKVRKKKEKNKEEDTSDTKSEKMSLSDARPKDNKGRRKRTQTVAFVSTPPMEGKDIPPPPPLENDILSNNTAKLPTGGRTKPTKQPANTTSPTPATNGLQSWDPKQQELERENLKYKAQLRTELTKVIDELEIKFKEFEMRLDRCLTKQCLRVQKHRQVIQVYQTQTQIENLEENEEKASNYEDKILNNRRDNGANSNSDDDDSGSGHKKNSSDGKDPHKDTSSNLSVIESKIANEEQIIEKISLQKEYDKFQQKIYALKDWVNTL